MEPDSGVREVFTQSLHDSLTAESTIDGDLWGMLGAKSRAMAVDQFLKLKRLQNVFAGGVSEDKAARCIAHRIREPDLEIVGKTIYRDRVQVFHGGKQ